ncbi:MAG TPA: bifunctional hydroxymethylpyrimidine kinase/phosphomethylpyrimidine kinase [Allosphingosinicella sp.]|jgi:hydroxymethylpyrimidine/phosphomethylpyrimidine kinase|nr:bifunctional hydroxymethylpyrimidine kinase/phosphomethylpyrimidine kinase [Allosphingosinicella sp.]
MICPRILIIAGSDSGGGAGIQADIKTVTMLGGHAMTAITALTAQNTMGVTGVMAVPAAFVVEQMEAVISDIGVDAVKIGMIGSAETVHAVADRLESLSVPIVFDPVMIATSGSILADAETIAAFGRLMELSTVTTPNRPELEALSGQPIADERSQAAAAEEVMLATGCPAILAKGGHWPGGEIRGTSLAGEPFGYSTDNRLFDELYVLGAEGWQEFSWDHERIETRHTHGTGCTLASGIATELGRGCSLPDAILRARDYLLATLRSAPGYGAGSGPVGHALGTSPLDWIHKKSR